MAAKVRIQDFPATKHARKGVHYRFWSTPSRAATIDPLDSDELKKTKGDPSMTLTDEAALVASIPLQLKEMKIVGGDRLRSRPGRLPTLFFGVVRLRARPQRQLLDSPEANRLLNRFQNRVLTVAQLRNLVIAILQHLPELDPGDHRPIEDEGALSFNLGAVCLATVTITITRRLTAHCRACSAAGQPKPFPNLFVEFHVGLKKKIWVFNSRDFGLVKKKKLGFMRRFGRLGLKEIDLGISGVSPEKRRERGRGCCNTIRYNPNDCVLGNWNPGSNGGLVCILEYQIPWSKLVSNTVWVNQILGQSNFGPIELHCNYQFLQRCCTFWRPDPLLHMQVSNSVGPGLEKTDWAALQLPIPSYFGELSHQHIWAIIAINFPFQFLDILGYYFKLPSLRTRMFSREMECKDWETRD